MANARLDYMATGRITDPRLLITESIKETRHRIGSKYLDKMARDYTKLYARSDFPKQMQQVGMQLSGIKSIDKLPPDFNRHVKYIQKKIDSARMKKRAIWEAVRISNSQVEHLSRAVMLYLLRRVKELMPNLNLAIDIVIFMAPRKRGVGPFNSIIELPKNAKNKKYISYLGVTPDVYFANIDGRSVPVFDRDLYGELRKEKVDLSIFGGIRHVTGISFSHTNSSYYVPIQDIVGGGIYITKTDEKEIVVKFCRNSDLTRILSGGIYREGTPIAVSQQGDP